MKTILKKLLSCTLAIFMCISTIGFVSAETTVKTISATEKTTILTSEFNTLYGGLENHNSTGNYGFCTNAFAETVIDVLEEGYYEFSMNALPRNGGNVAFNVLIDEDYVNKAMVWGNGTADINAYMFDMYLTKGQHVLKIAYAGAIEQYHYLYDVSFAKKTNDNICITVNGIDVADTSLYTNIAYGMYYLGNGASSEYKVNVPKDMAGYYQMSMSVGRADSNITSYDVTVNGTAINSSKKAIPGYNSGSNSPYVSQNDVDLCIISLNEGENTVKFTNKTAFMYFSKINFTKVDVADNVTQVSGTGTSEISFDNAALSSVGYVSDNGNHYKFGAGSTATVDVYVETAGVYTMNVNVLTRNGISNTWNVYVDGVLEDTYKTWIGSIWYNGEAIDIDFKTAGLHTIKIETPAGVTNAYMNGFTLTKKANDYKAQWIMGTDATGTGSVTWEKYQIDNGGNVNEYAEYKVNVESNGVYRITSQTTYNEYELTTSLLTVNGTDIGTKNIGAAVRGSYGDEKITTVLGEAYFNQGENIIRITNKDLPGGQTTMITRIKVEKIANATLVSETEETAVSFDSAVLYNIETNHSGTGNYKFASGATATATVNVTKAGTYTLSGDILTRDGVINTWKVYVDDVLQSDFYSWMSSGLWESGELADVEFKTAGVHTVKIEMTTGNAYMNGFKLKKEAFDAKALWIKGTDISTATGHVAYEKYAISNAGNANQYAEYTVNAETAGTYQISAITTWNNYDLTSAVLTVNGKELDPVTVKAVSRGTYGDVKSMTVLGEASLKAGENTIRITNKDLPGGQTLLIARVKVDKISDEVSHNLRFHIRDYVQAYAPNSNQGSTAILGQDGSNPDNTLFRVGDWAEYTVEITKAGAYELGLAIGDGTNSTQTIKAYVDGKDSMTGSWTGNSGAYTKTDNVFGKVNFLEPGTYTLKIEKTAGGFAYVSHVFLNYFGEIGTTSIPATGTTEIQAVDYLAGYDVSKNTSTMTVEGGNISFGSQDYIEYYLDAEKEGVYRLDITTACETSGKPVYDVLIDSVFKYRAEGANKGWSTFEASTGYVKLNEGKNLLRIYNCGHPDFYLSKIGVTYVAEVFDATENETDVISYINGGVSGMKSAGTVITFGVNAADDGLYRLNLSARQMGNAVVNIYNNDKLLSVLPLEVATAAAVNNTDFIKLNKGLNIVKIKIAKGNVIFAGIDFAQQTLAMESELNSVAKAIENAATLDEIKALIIENESVLGVDFDALTDGIEYKEFVLARLSDRKFSDCADLLRNIYDAVDKEKTSPSVKVTLSDGTLTINAKTDAYSKDGTLVAAVYESGRMMGMDYKTFTRGNDVTLTIANCKDTYQVKFFYIDSISKIQPITLANGIYKNIYVSATATADGDGSAEKPFNTIAQAKAKVAELQASMTGDIVVNIASGYYELSETEVFTEAHGGRDGYKVIYKGTDAEKLPIIGGGKKVEGWQSEGNGIYSASFDGLDVRNLYVNGYQATRARSKMYEAASREGTTLTANIPNVTFAKPEDLVLVWFNEWANHYTSVKGYSKSGTTATFTLSDISDVSTGTLGIDLYKNDNSDEAFCAWHNEYHKSFFIENAKELLDEAGEFYYDKSASRIYYKPYSNENINTAEIYASQIESLIEVTGTNGDKVTNITFENLGFRYSAWNNNDIKQIQATQYIISNVDGVKTYAEIPSQITFDYVDSAEIKNCEFACLGSNALSLNDSVTNSKVSGNIFRDLGGGAIVVGTYDHEHETGETNQCTEIEISDNVIRRTSLVWRSMPALTVYYEKDIDILRNDIKDVPYSGMSLGWGWGNSTAKFGGFTVANNKIENVMTTLTDGGHIYTLGDMPGTVIKNNYMIKSVDGRGGIYNDSGSGNIKILSNVIDIYENRTNYWWFQGSFKTHDLYAEGNFSHSKLGAQERANGVNNQNVNNTNNATSGSWDGAGNAAAQAIIDGAGVSSEYSALINKALLPSFISNPLALPSK